MDIDLTLLYNGTVNDIDITNTYKIPKEYFENSDVLDIEDVEVNGKIKLQPDEEGNYNAYIDCSIKTSLILEDAVSLEQINYPISIEYSDLIEENCKKNEKLLDIFEFLWENIVLEVPMHLTEVQSIEDFHGEGWKLVDEGNSSSNTDNPFKDLLKEFDKE